MVIIMIMTKIRIMHRSTISHLVAYLLFPRISRHEIEDENGYSRCLDVAVDGIDKDDGTNNTVQARSTDRARENDHA